MDPEQPPAYNKNDSISINIHSSLNPKEVKALRQLNGFEDGLLISTNGQRDDSPIASLQQQPANYSFYKGMRRKLKLKNGLIFGAAALVIGGCVYCKHQLLWNGSGNEAEMRRRMKFEEISIKTNLYKNARCGRFKSEFDGHKYNYGSCASGICWDERCRDKETRIDSACHLFNKCANGFRCKSNGCTSGRCKGGVSMSCEEHSDCYSMNCVERIWGELGNRRKFCEKKGYGKDCTLGGCWEDGLTCSKRDNICRRSEGQDCRGPGKVSLKKGKTGHGSVCALGRCDRKADGSWSPRYYCLE